MRKAAWIMPNILDGEGSGGQRTLFDNIQYLSKKGYTCDLYMEDRGQIKDVKEVQALVKKYFGHVSFRGEYYLGYHLKNRYDVIFATAWYTAEVVKGYKTKAKKIYFIQDFEAFFYPIGPDYLKICDTYQYGLNTITIGRWLSKKMEEEFGQKSQFFDFCADLNVYYNKKQKRERAVCFICQPEKPRRCSQLGIEALGIVKDCCPDVKILFYGSNKKKKVWYEHEELGILTKKECNDLYNQTAVGLCISASNPSRIPFEMMASGLPVVDIYLENNLYDFYEDGITLAHYSPASIAQAVIDLLRDDKKREFQSKKGLEFMEGRKMEIGFNQLYNAVENIISNGAPLCNDYNKKYENPPVYCRNIPEKYIKKNHQNAMNMIKRGSIYYLKHSNIIRKSQIVNKLYKSIKKYMS